MSLKVGYLRTCILMPFFILILLVSSVYGIYMFYYVLPNLTDFYWYDRPQNTITQSDQSIYPIFKEILKLESHFMSLIPSFEFSKKIIPNNEFNFKQNNIKNEVSISESHYKRGLILFIFIHYFLFWFIFSTIKTIITKPGSVSYEWTVKIEEKLNDCYEEQKFLLKLKKENLKNQKENPKKNGEEPNVSSNNGGEETEKEDEIVQAENNLKKEALSPEERKNQNNIENKDLNNFKTNEQGIQGANSEKSITFQENEYDDEFTESENAVINQVALAMVMEKENSRYYLIKFLFYYEFKFFILNI